MKTDIDLGLFCCDICGKVPKDKFAGFPDECYTPFLYEGDCICSHECYEVYCDEGGKDIILELVFYNQIDIRQEDYRTLRKDGEVACAVEVGYDVKNKEWLVDFDDGQRLEYWAKDLEKYVSEL